MTGGAREISAPGMALRTAAILFVFVIIFTGLLSGAYLWTKPAIEASAAEEKKMGGKPVALVFEAAAPDGYAGKVRLLIALRADGTLAGVRVTQHKETPGLGDYVDPKKDKNKAAPWIAQFAGLSLATVSDPGWRVRKDGGRFEYVAGATVTPRAVVKAVNKAVPQRDELFAQTGGKP